MDSMSFSADQMISNAGTASQHLPLVDDPIVVGAVLRSFAQYIELNWACTPSDLIEGLKAHPYFNS